MDINEMLRGSVAMHKGYEEGRSARLVLDLLRKWETTGTETFTHAQAARQMRDAMEGRSAAEDHRNGMAR